MCRTPETCAHRKWGPYIEEGGSANCQLIQQLLNNNSRATGQVTREMCASCCRGFEPSATDLNVVVASLLYHEIEIILQQNSLDASRLEQLISLQEFCENSLPVMGIDEDDLPERHSPSSSIPSLERIKEILPTPAVRHSILKTWSVGLTTSPRRLPTLEQSLSQFLSCGWDDVLLFVDGEVHIAEQHRHFSKTVRSPKIGAWPNFYLGLQELYHRAPHADAYLMLQDDVQWPLNWPLKRYLEDMLWPGDVPCLISLYCGAEQTSAENGWSIHPHWKWGALAFLFPNELIGPFLTDEIVRSHIRKTDESGLSGIDIVIGDWAARNNIPVFQPTPSLVQHSGEISAIWRTSRAVGVRAASKYIADFV